MGKGRAPCCDKTQVKRGPWSPAEDLRLITFIQKHGHENWRALPKQAGLLRCGKSCRLRWINYLRPDVKRGNFTKEEEDTIVNLHRTLGNKWSKIASYLPGRTDNEIKNVWNTHLKKRLATKNSDSDGDEPKELSTTSSSSSISSTIMSGSKKSMEMELKTKTSDGSVNKRPRISENTQDSDMEVSNDDQFGLAKECSSISSDNSNVTNSSQVDVSKPEDQFGSLSDYLVPYDVHNVLEEVNKPDDIQDNAIEIPLEADLEFWNMLDSLSSFQSNDDDQGQLQNIEATQSSNNIVDAYNGEDENRRWLRYLENELGLEATREEIQETNLSKDVNEEILINSENLEYNIPMKDAEGDSGVEYYHLWPSS